MPWTWGVAGNFFVAMALAVFAVTLVVAGRRRPEGVLLAVFLGLVAGNFCAISLATLGSADGSLDPGLESVAFLLLAVDPFYLLAFTTAFPYRRRPVGARVVLGTAAVLGGIGALAALVAPGTVVGPDASWPRWVILGNLAVSYAFAWILAVRGVADAPTPLLAQRASWMAVAVGVAVLPRMALVPNEFGLMPEPWLPAGLQWWRLVAAAGIGALAMIAVFGAGVLAAPRPIRNDTLASRALRVTGLLTLAIAAVTFALAVVDTFSPGQTSGWRNAMPYSFRWLVFAAILVVGMLSFDVVAFQRARERVFPGMGAALAAVAGAIVALTVALGEGASPGLAALLAAGVGLAGAPAGYVAVRSAVERFRPASAAPEAQRRLELYRAAVESAWARGPPDAAALRALGRDRRAFGVSRDEARALEHVVAASQPTREEGLRPGEEPVPGLVIGDPLGHGAHGRVYSATRHPGGDRVVVKEMRTDRLGAQQVREKLLAEVKALRSLRHPNIVPLLETHPLDGRYLLVLARVEGRPVAERCAKGALTENDVHLMASGLLAALGAAHAAGVVHRDVKPENVLVDEEGRARLTDFGIALTAAWRPGPGATMAGIEALAEGTPLYMAPEQAKGGPVGPPADLFSAGLVVLEALVGSAGVQTFLRGRDPRDPAAVPPRLLGKVPVAWRPWLRRALDPDPGRRFATAAEMAAALPPPRGP